MPEAIEKRPETIMFQVVFGTSDKRYAVLSRSSSRKDMRPKYMASFWRVDLCLKCTVFMNQRQKRVILAIAFYGIYYIK